ncbi:DUF2971 domain-containing protein [Brevundimonas sp. GCM10030266]|uniref:DUF2971 domain-containing protein n=1 Tax=Brevundimonas sp. GCM10030266 TaxID=3273386 RepID=UPI003616C7DB
MRNVGEAGISGNEMLWRYLRLDRFLSLVSDGKLYFSSANEFDDPFEGAISVETNSVQDKEQISGLYSAEGAFRDLKRLTKISCWHRATFESDAMWKLYAGDHKGIAICTTPDRMRAAIKPFRLQPHYGFEDIWAGPVDYVDLTAGRIKQTGMLARFFIKHRAFEWEREFRLAISVRGAAEFGVQVPEQGIFVDVDLDVLAERFVVGTTINDDERSMVEERLSAAGLADRLHFSSLLGSPRYS